MERVSTIGYGAWLRDRRHTANLTQVELAKELNVSHRAVQSWEGGKRYPRPAMRRVIARFFAGQVAA